MTATLYRGGVVRAEGLDGATAMLVEDAAVTWLGNDESNAAGSADSVIDLQGALVTPAFVDAHIHATAAGLAMTGLNLNLTVSLEAALADLERYSRRTGGAPILGHGWDETRWPEQRPPTRQELDRASYGGVVYLSRIDSHSAVVSSALLAAVPEAQTLPGFDESGWVRQAAHHAVRRVARETLTPAQRTTAQRATRQRAAALGIGCLHEMGGPDISGAEDLQALLALADEESGPEIIAYWAEPGGIEVARDLGAAGAGGDLFIDGSIGSHTAFLRHRYVDRPTRGELYLDHEGAATHIAACVRNGMQAGFHAIGDDALAGLLNVSYRAAELAIGAGWPLTTGHRVEHAEMVDDQLIGRIAELGIIASVQPAFDAAWGGEDGMYAQRLGRERALAMNPLARLVAAGVVLAFGSDAPVTPLDPWGTVQAAVHHRTPGSGLTADQAFAAHTTGGWLAAGRPGEGVLAPGAPATFAVWSAEAIDPGSTLPELTSDSALPACLRTVVRGQTIHDVEGAFQ